MKIKEAKTNLFLVGNRKDELGGSVYYEINNELGANVPEIDFQQQRNMIYAIINCIENNLFSSCHDISDGGLFTTIAEMILGGNADGKIGALINIDSDLRNDKILFSETPGFVFEVENKNISKVKSIFKKYNLEINNIGKTMKNDSLIIINNNKEIINLKIEKLKQAWTSGFVDALK